ncbi:hypothetical protein CISG_03409 [Coccidioides immitis RMSCC 3703]|uniref:Uncharacterized protein n=1 Tax=Coccidioides immitis RMSCC 3703 TaxID=454286 RepID=A0A0J8QPC8_COCIT|nr:hypothetical protein CISG_03409 [Coccidioides immitis RMSCC 3703]
MAAAEGSSSMTSLGEQNLDIYQGRSSFLEIDFHRTAFLQEHCFDMRRIRSLTQHTQRRLHVDIAAQMGLQPPKPRLSSAKRQQYTSLFSVSLEPCWPACLAIAASNLNVRPLATIKTFWSATADPRPVVPG